MYKIVRMFQNEHKPNRTIRKNLTLEEARAHCRDPETSWKTATSAAARRRTRQYGSWFDGYEEQ